MPLVWWRVELRMRRAKEGPRVPDDDSASHAPARARLTVCQWSRLAENTFPEAASVALCGPPVVGESWAVLYKRR